MKRKKILDNYEVNNFNYHKSVMIKSELTGETFYEIGDEITTDVAEAVSIMMRSDIVDNKIWDRSFNLSDVNSVCPQKCLFWLTGAYKEWNNLENFKNPWSECGLMFQEEFGLMVMKVLRKSKKLSDIRDGFRKYLNLPILYDFALSQDLIK